MLVGFPALVVQEIPVVFVQWSIDGGTTWFPYFAPLRQYDFWGNKVNYLFRLAQG